MQNGTNVSNVSVWYYIFVTKRTALTNNWAFTVPLGPFLLSKYFLGKKKQFTGTTGTFIPFLKLAIIWGTLWPFFKVFGLLLREKLEQLIHCRHELYCNFSPFIVAENRALFCAWFDLYSIENDQTSTNLKLNLFSYIQIVFCNKTTFLSHLDHFREAKYPNVSNTFEN